jgi:hypothetical protein
MSKGVIGSFFKSIKIFIVYGIRNCNPKADLLFRLVKGQSGRFKVLMRVTEDYRFVQCDITHTGVPVEFASSVFRCGL